MTMRPCRLSMILLLLAGWAGAEAAVQNPVPNTGDWFVTELFVNGAPYAPGQGPLAPSTRYLDGYYSMYLVEVLPGQYTLGLSCSVGLQPVRVYLSDRWPYAPDSRRIALPMGPTVRTHPKILEYRWQLGISPGSTSTVLYVLVERASGKACAAHSIYVAAPPILPGTTLEPGVSYLQGPSDLTLVGDQTYASYVLGRPQPPAGSSPRLPRLPLPGDLIKNGAFTEGLNHWQSHNNYETAREATSVSLRQEGLRIWSDQKPDREGVLQLINADVSEARALILRADVRVSRQAQGGTGPQGREAPIAIAVCYQDVKDDEYCHQANAWKGFYGLEPKEPGETRNGQKVPQGLWYRYQADLMQLDPKPKFIKYVSLEGSGWPEREGWVRDVHLIKRGKSHE